MNSDQKRVCAEILTYYGDSKQMNKAIEELAELIQCLSKSINIRDIDLPFFKTTAMLAIASEIADCKIMLEQMEFLIEAINPDASVNSQVNQKLARQQQRIEAECKSKK